MATLSSPDLKSNLIKVLSASDKPMAAASILKALPVGGRPKTKALAELLAQMEHEGAVVSVPRQARKYVCGPIEVWVRNTILRTVSTAPQTEAKLLKMVTASNAELSRKVLASLRSEGVIFAHPPLTKAGKPAFGLSPPDPVTYISKDVDKLIASAVGKGFSTRAVRDALLRYVSGGSKLPPSAAPMSVDTLIAAMRRLEPRVDNGAAVPIRNLRELLAERCSKQDFDSLVIALATSGTLELQSHAWPERLTAQEREMLISNGRGGWFDSAALRKRVIA